LTVPTLYENNGLGFTLTVGACACIISLILSLFLIAVDSKAKSHDKQIYSNINFILNLEQDLTEKPEQEPVKLSLIQSLQ